MGARPRRDRDRAPLEDRELSYDIDGLRAVVESDSGECEKGAARMEEALVTFS